MLSINLTSEGAAATRMLVIVVCGESLSTFFLDSLKDQRAILIEPWPKIHRFASYS